MSANSTRRLLSGVSDAAAGDAADIRANGGRGEELGGGSAGEMGRGCLHVGEAGA
jgi:hypothetical protein